MGQINLPPFYVGQKVVCLQDGKYGITKKGDIVVVLGLMQSKCGCWLIDIGQKPNFPATFCIYHPSTIFENFGIKWAAARLFAPLEENFQSISLEKVLENETPLISVN